MILSVLEIFRHSVDLIRSTLPCFDNLFLIRNKFDLLANQVIGNVDVLAISETKLNASFPFELFKIPGFSTPFRRDRDQHGGELLVF